MTAARPVRRWPRVLVLLVLGLALSYPLAVVSVPELLDLSHNEVNEAAERYFKALAARDQVGLSQIVKGKNTHMVMPVMPMEQSMLAAGVIRAELGRSNRVGQNASIAFVFKRTNQSVSKLLEKEGVPPGIQQAQEQWIEQAVGQVVDKRGMLALQQQEDRWVVVELRYPLGEATEALINFESGKVVPRAPARKLPEFAFLRATSRQEYDRAWQVDCKAAGEPAGKVWDSLMKDGMFYFAGAALGKDWREKPCTFALEKRSRLEVGETIARQTGLTLATPGGLTLAPRARASPSTFAGPFLIRVSRLEEKGQHATGTIRLEALAIDLPPAVNSLSRYWGQFWGTPEVRGPGGRDLFFARRWALTPSTNLFQGIPVPSSTQVIWQSSREVPLRGLTADLDAVATLQGEVRVPLPSRIDQGTLRPGGQQTTKVGDMELACTATEVTFSGPNDRVVACRFLDKTGEAIGVEAGSHPATRRINVPAATNAVECYVVTLATVTHTYKLENIPLTARPPKALQEPEFAGHPAPVSLSLSGGMDNANSMVVQVRNHCQKDVETVQFQLRRLDNKGKPILDAKGQPLDSESHEWPVINQRPWNTLAAFSATSFTLTTARPPGAARVEFQLEEVLFCDGTTWSPPRKR